MLEKEFPDLVQYDFGAFPFGFEGFSMSLACCAVLAFIYYNNTKPKLHSQQTQLKQPKIPAFYLKTPHFNIVFFQLKESVSRIT
jgi:hypothetical protein